MSRQSLGHLAVTATLACALSASWATVAPPTDPSDPHSARAAQSATVTILSGRVEVSADAKTYRELVDGQVLRDGAWLRTGSRSSALMTLFDGTEVVLPADAQFDLRNVSFNPRSVGLSMPQVARLAFARLHEDQRVTSTADGPVPPSVGLIRG